ncbi:uncharacterized protein LOC135836756 [Planococcus citri]|uniref:uncharacterized protein LOC135836756 n=1 Tax=Planococcus citri TaxID=170843 RepID=UPI0031F928CE
MTPGTLQIYLFIISITHYIAYSSTYSTNLTSIAIKSSFKLRPPIAHTSDYLILVQNSNIFVDKSLLLEAVLADPEEKVLALLGPEKWGKTVNLRMIEHFTRIPTDSRGNPTPPRNTPIYRLFNHNEVLLLDGQRETLRKPLLLTEKAPGTIQMHMGKYPTIYLNLSPLLNGTDYHSVMTHLSVILGQVFKQHSYMKEVIKNWYKNESISCTEKAELNSTLEEFTNVEQLKTETSDLIRAIGFLSKLLYTHFKSRAVVLFDDYDVLVDISLNENITQIDKQAIHNVLSLLFLHSLKINTFLQKGILTGRHGISKQIKQDDIVNEYKSILDQTFEFYGFLQRDVDAIFEILQIPKTERDKVLNWHEGYRICKDETALRFSPYSIANFISHRSLNHVPFKSDKLIEILVQNKEFRKALMQLLLKNYDSLQSSHLDFNKDQIDYLNQAAQNKTVEFDKALPILYAYLYSSGYLTRVNEDIEKVTLRLTNNEARFKMANSIVSFYTKCYNISAPTLSQLTSQLHEFIEMSTVYYPDVETSLQNFVNSLPIFDDRYKHQKDPQAPSDILEVDHLVRVILHTLALNVSYHYNYQTLTPSEGMKSYVTLYKDKRAIMIDFMIDTSVQEIISIISKRVDAMNSHTQNDIFRWIGISLGTDRKINILAKTDQRK